jgi:excisionase family DNA binding protein
VAAVAEPIPQNELELLTVVDVCELFKVTRDWVYDEVEAGRMPSLRLGRKHLRFRRRDLEEYLAGRRPAGHRERGQGTQV